jgi:glycosyltransferase involved in cell wall biosynthesis
VIAATSPQFFTAVGGWALAACRRRPFVFELSDLWPASIVAVGAMKDNALLHTMERLELFLYRRAAAIAALTDAFKRNLVDRGIAPDKIAVVRNGVDLRRYAPIPRDQALAAEWRLEGRFTVGYVGTHGLAHGLHNVLAAAALLKGEDRVRFLLVGPGAARNALIADARKRGLDNVVFMPPQPKDLMPAVWSLCDVALIHLRDDPVFADVIPSKIFEAMAMGLPLLLALPAGEATRLVEADGAGIAVAPADPAALAAAVRRLSSDATLRRSLAGAALAAAPRHSRAFQATAMMAVLRAAATGDGASATRYVESLAAEPVDAPRHVEGSR